MAISESDIKRLWGSAAGRCAFPGCNADCLVSISGKAQIAPIIIGEMAHVIARQPSGPRGKPEGGDNTYENLILLCPTHHTLVDKADEGTFPEEALIHWKRNHEERVRNSLQAPLFFNRTELNLFVLKLLIENHVCWSTYGPEGAIAQKNPNSNAGEMWPYRKLSVLIPNNKKIVSAVTGNNRLFSNDEYGLCAAFVEHAAGFEQNSIRPLEDIPRFPANFEEIFR